MGMPQPIPNLEARAAPGYPGLLATATPLNLSVGDAWLDGVSYIDECSPPPPPRTVFGCEPDTGPDSNLTDKAGYDEDDGTTDAWEAFENPPLRSITTVGGTLTGDDVDPGVLASYATGMVRCNALMSRDDAAAIARRRLAANLSWQMERAFQAQLVAGAGAVADPVNVADSLATLEQLHGECSGDEATIHARPYLVTLWVALHLVTRDASGLLRTALGSRVVAGRGYDFAEAADPELGVVERAYVTGPVGYELGAVADPSSTPVTSSDRARRNEVEVIVEQPFLLRTPACCLLAVDVATADLSGSGGGSGGDGGFDGGSP